MKSEVREMKSFFKFSHWLKRGGPFWVLLLSIHGQAFGSNGVITDFKMSSCGKQNCIQLQASKAYSGMVSSNYAFESVNIVIKDKKTKKETRLRSSDAYFDSLSNKIYIRSIANSDGTEAIYDLETDTLATY